MIYWVIRVGAVALVALSMLAMFGKAAANGLSDAVLAAVAAYVSFRFLKGYRLEDQADTATDAGIKAKLQTDAKTEYMLISLQSRVFLYIGLGGCMLKIFAVIATIEPLCARLRYCW